MSWNWLDIVALLLLAAGVWTGYRQGLIRQLTRLVAWAAALVAAFLWHDEVAQFLAQRFPLDLPVSGWGDLNPALWLWRILSFLGLALLARWLVLLAGSLLHQVGELPLLSWVNHWLGAIISLAKTVIILVLLINLLSLIPHLKGLLAQSYLASEVLRLSPQLLDFTSTLFRLNESHPGA